MNGSLEANFTNEVGVEKTIRFLKNIPGLWVLQECRRAWAKEGEEYTYADLMERAASARSIEQHHRPGSIRVTRATIQHVLPNIAG